MPTRCLAEEHVLVVDDDEHVLRYCTRLLESAGIVCATAPTPSRALELVAADPKIRVAVLDYHMPGVDLEALVFALKRSRPGILLVGHSGIAGPEEYAALGVERYCRKGGTGAELLSEIQRP